MLLFWNSHSRPASQFLPRWSTSKQCQGPTVNEWLTAWNKICSCVDITVTGCLLGPSHYMISTIGSWIKSNRKHIVAFLTLWYEKIIDYHRINTVWWHNRWFIALAEAKTFFCLFVMHTVYLYMQAVITIKWTVIIYNAKKQQKVQLMPYVNVFTDK